MTFEELVKTRQSCRSYAKKEVTREDILAVVEAARLAPSACNSQPYHFTVCTGETAHQVAQCTATMGANKFTVDVPCFIVISEDSYKAKVAAGSRLKDQDLRSVDIGIAAAHMDLCATERGLGTCLLGWFDEKKLQDVVGSKNRIRLVVALGYAVEGYPIRPKVRKSLEKLADFK